jgi:predicted DNA-binding protein
MPLPFKLHPTDRSIASAIFNLSYLSKNTKKSGHIINSCRRYRMDANRSTEEAMLVNFRAPKSIVETLDQLSKFYHRTRTSILLDLITSWINEKTYDVPLKVRQLDDLKFALNSHERSAYGNRRPVSTSLVEETSRNGSERIPASFFSPSMTDLDDVDNGRF